MSKIILLIVLVILVVFIFFGFDFNSAVAPAPSETLSPTPSSSIQPGIEKLTIVAQNLDTPWGMALLPDGSMLVTERAGRVRLIEKNGTLDPVVVATVSNAKEIGEGGLLGITLHPNFSSNNFVYLYYTYESSGDNIFNRVVRMTYANRKLSDQKTILDRIPGAPNHDGGRIKFGPEGMLYIGTGDAQEPSQSQDKNSLAGKILRVTADGKPAPGNPFNNEVYSYGHRNVQGLAWDKNGKLWATEHGRSGAQSGLDEINLIEPDKNYGWPEIQGNETRAGMEAPRRNSGSTTWAPAGAVFVGNSFFFTGLRGQTLYEAIIQNDQVTSVKSNYAGEFGRLRDVILSPGGTLYISTSNHDGRGQPKSGDDKIIKIEGAFFSR